MGETGYPAIELMTLAETGTRALLGAVFGAADRGDRVRGAAGAPAAAGHAGADRPRL